MCSLSKLCTIQISVIYVCWALSTIALSRETRGTADSLYERTRHAMVQLEESLPSHRTTYDYEGKSLTRTFELTADGKILCYAAQQQMDGYTRFSVNYVSIPIGQAFQTMWRTPEPSPRTWVAPNGVVFCADDADCALTCIPDAFGPMHGAIGGVRLSTYFEQATKSTIKDDKSARTGVRCNHSRYGKFDFFLDNQNRLGSIYQDIKPGDTMPNEQICPEKQWRKISQEVFVQRYRSLSRNHSSGYSGLGRNTNPNRDSCSAAALGSRVEQMDRIAWS